eukprot:1625943-Rhodomonas_salina.1
MTQAWPRCLAHGHHADMVTQPEGRVTQTGGHAGQGHAEQGHTPAIQTQGHAGGAREDLAVSPALEACWQVKVPPTHWHSRPGPSPGPLQ